jgi:hypothetical protein
MEVHEYMPRPASFAEVLPQHAELEKLAQARIAEGRQSRQPFLCVHAKSLVVDDRLAFIGSFDFHRCYREAGDFPGTDGILSRKEIMTRIYKAVGPVLTPML